MTEDEKKSVKEAAEKIYKAFTFTEAMEGHHFWIYVYHRLNQMSVTGDPGRVIAKPNAPRVPTDEDAKKRPMARFRDRPDAGWHEDVLVAVLPEGQHRFVSASPDSWRFCELIEEPSQ